jgi:hypothetical protein
MTTTEALKIEEDDFWDELPDNIKDDVLEALEQSARADGKPHEEVMKKYKRSFL